MDQHSQPPIKPVLKAGLLTIAIFTFGFFLWSLLAPLDTAAVAPGRVIVDTYRKTIQHLEGGIVKGLYATEGAKVKAGDLLVELDDTQAKARLEIETGQLNNLLALEARLIAERDRKDQIIWPERLSEQPNNPKIQQLMKTQEDILKANQDTLNGQLIILNQQVKQFEKQIEGLEAQVAAVTEQYDLITEEKEAVETLEKEHVVPKVQLLAIKREAAKLLGNKGEYLGQIAKAQQQIGESKQRIITLQDDYLKDVLKQLDETQTKIADGYQHVIATEDILKRTRIIAPQDGTIINLQVHTIGGVVTPGGPLMDLIPKRDDLIIEAEVNPLDIDIVHPGLLAKIKLTAYKQRNTPTISGVVQEVSPDIFTNEKTGAHYFKARILVNKEELAKMRNLTLYPGMPANVFIVTDKRSAFRYFLQPITDSFDKAFKEE